MKTFNLSRLIASISFIAILMFSCSKDSGSNGGGGGGGNPPNTIVMGGSAFTPATLQVPAGTTVTWRNTDNMTHTVTENNGLFDSGNMNPGATFQYTFDAIGTYNYRCLLHAGMTGNVVVLGR